MNVNSRTCLLLAAVFAAAPVASARWDAPDGDFPPLPDYSRKQTSAWYSDGAADDFRRPLRGVEDRPAMNRDEVRYRIPIPNRVSDFDADRSFTNRLDLLSRERAPFDRYGRDDFGDDDFGSEDWRNSDDLNRWNRTFPEAVPSRRLPAGRDPFIPAPTPVDRRNDETRSIDEQLRIRYQNPVTVRALKSMGTEAALRLYAEVNQKIDERSLAPTSYDVRVRRALRNLTMALDNPAFVNGLGIDADSFRTDAFRETLARLAGNSQVRTYQDARDVMGKVMAATRSVGGLTPAIVAFEFASASIDTLDKFSGMEIADPAFRNGAELEGHRSAALDEEIVGVGVEVKEHADGLLVVKPLRGGPAAEAGILAGDIIVAIGNREIAGMRMANSVDLMKGTSGSRLSLRIFRDGKGERDFVLTRRKVRVWSVNDAMLLSGTDVGYLNLSRFSQSSTAEVDQALNALHGRGMKSLIVDLRGNPGGLLTTCVEISDRFLPCGTIVSTRGRLNTDNMVEEANYSRTWSVPLVVLVDGDSASASEIFAAAIQDNKRGVIVGTKTYGKGSVQTHFPLNAVSGDLRLTTALFYSPNGRKMAGEGVTPDVEVVDRDGVANGDEVLIEATRIARSRTLADMARASGTCRSRSTTTPRSSSLNSISDPGSAATTVR